MILFVSGRCDIPAFFSIWFYKRMDEGFVDVRNPYNEHQISRIMLNENTVDCILFCTKNPIPMLERLDEITLPYIFQITITPYNQDIERQVQDKKQVIDAVKYLSKKLGKDRVIVRYDPILLNSTYTVDYHKRAFEKLCASLTGYVNKIIISFVDMYKNTKENMRIMALRELDDIRMVEIAKVLGPIGKAYDIKIKTCAESINLEAYGIQKGECMNAEDIEKVIGHPFEKPSGKSVRKTCNCLPSVDIGDYNCCLHYCLYCYANYDQKSVKDNFKRHNPNSTVLLGELTDKDKITIRSGKKVKQTTLF